MLDSVYAIEFNSNRIDQVPGVELYNHDLTALPNRDIKINKIARASRSIITSSEYTQKNIPVWLEVCSGTRQQTEATITNVKALIQGQNGTLKGLQGGYEVTYTVTMNEFNIEWQGSKAWVEVVFIASDPIGTSTEEISLATLSSITTSSSSATFIVSGSFNAEPVISITINSITGGTAKVLNIYNARTNQGITIDGNFTAGQIILIDSLNKTITSNGGNIDFTGLFPVFPPGSQQVTYTDTFTTRNVDVTMTYKPRLI